MRRRALRASGTYRDLGALVEPTRHGVHPFCGRCTDETIASAAPGAVSANGFGSIYYGSSDRCATCGSVVRNLFMCVLWIPVWPMGRYRIVRLGSGHFVGRRFPHSAGNPYGVDKKTAALIAEAEARTREAAESWPAPPPSGLADHPRLRGRRFRDAEEYWELGFPANALDEYEKVLASHEAVLAADDLATLQIRQRVAEAYLAVGRPIAAVAMLEQTGAHLRRILGPLHPDSRRAQDDALNARSRLGLTRDQINLITKELAQLSKTLGPEHPQVLRTAGALGVTHLNGNRSLPAIEVLREALGRSENALGAGHPDTGYLRDRLKEAYAQGLRTGKLKEPGAADLRRRLGL